jgi:phospholipid/cholesterol/gamma-HCH transport system permease protein
VLENWTKRALLELQEYVLLVGESIYATFTKPFYFHDVVEQLDAIGVGSLTVVLLTGFFTGAVLALQAGLSLDQFGARPYVGRLVSASMVRELGPVLTALMITGRVGSGIAAELGSMGVRMLAGVLMVPVLTVISDFTGIFGGWVIAHWQLGVATSLYWTSVIDGLYIQDAWMGLLKPFFLGFVIVTIGCLVGLRVKGGTQGVGRGTTQAVVAGSVAVLAVDFFVTKLIYYLIY